MEEQQSLTARQAAIVPIAAFMAVGDIPRLKTAIGHGLDADLSVSETKEILVQLYAYAGMPRSLNALAALMDVLKERQAKGIEDPAGPEPGPLPPPERMREVGAANQTKLVGRPATSPIYDFAPAIDDYLKSHLFGAIFARDNLDWQSREIATVSALSSLDGLDSQVQSHMNISLNVKLTEGQLRQIAEVVREQIGADAGRRAHAALQRAMASRK
jgi:alkylhydroperoxidase/carboxymuconolactone decarboxylase family protein YurZ